MDVDALELLLSQSLEEKTRKRGTYVSAACEYCKTKHLRCGGEKPVCGACVKAGVECLYPSEKSKRGRKRRKADEETMLDLVPSSSGGFSTKFSGDSVPLSVFKALITELHKQQAQTTMWETRFHDLETKVAQSASMLTMEPERFKFRVTDDILQMCVSTYKDTVLPFLSSRRVEGHVEALHTLSYYWHQLSSTNINAAVLSLDDTWQLFKHAVMFCHGMAVTGHVEGYEYFSKLAGDLQVELLHHREIHLVSSVEHPSLQFNYEELVISLFLLAYTHCYYMHTNTGIMIAFQAYEVLKTQFHNVSSSVAHCLYAMLIGFAGDSTEDRNYFMQKCGAADDLEPAPLVHTVAFLACSLLFPPAKSITFEERWNLNHLNRREEDLCLLDYWISRTQQSIMRFQGERPGVVSSDVILHWQSTIVGVQSVVSFARGDLGQSQQSASECINMNRQMNLPSVFTIMPLFYSLSVVRELTGAVEPDSQYLLNRKASPKTRVISTLMVPRAVGTSGSCQISEVGSMPTPPQPQQPSPYQHDSSPTSSATYTHMPVVHSVVPSFSSSSSSACSSMPSSSVSTPFGSSSYTPTNYSPSGSTPSQSYNPLSTPLQTYVPAQSYAPAQAYTPSAQQSVYGSTDMYMPHNQSTSVFAAASPAFAPVPNHEQTVTSPVCPSDVCSSDCVSSPTLSSAEPNEPNFDSLFTDSNFEMAVNIDELFEFDVELNQLQHELTGTATKPKGSFDMDGSNPTNHYAASPEGYYPSSTLDSLLL